jgi:glycosyltransferase involved in cell wall biosynthesis
MKFNKKKAIWIAWERHRRSIELAKAFNAKLFVLETTHNRLIKYTYLSVRTLSLIIREKPLIIFVQNPSIILATLLCIFKNFLNYQLITDRHSNFKLNTLNNRKLKWKLFHIFSKYSIRNADLTIITNGYLCDIVTLWGGHGFVLQDKIPNLNFGEKIKLKGKKNIVFVSTFSEDEPIIEVGGAAGLINNNWTIYITGNGDKYTHLDNLLLNLPNNVILTGYISEKEYQSLLLSADLLIVLTTMKHTLTCGAYEGIALLKPMILSDTIVIREYFNKGVVYTKPNSCAIANAISDSFLNESKLAKDIKTLRNELLLDWEIRFNKLKNIIKML